MTATAPEPLAIVGLGCRFPQAADQFAFWRLLADGVDAVRQVPPERWNVEAFPEPDAARSGLVMNRFGGYLDRIDEFDWRAFRVSPREAKFADPQHRLLLEVAWEALEDAGLPLERLAGTRTGVYVGIMWPDYAKLQARDYTRLEGYSANGSSFAYAANRISYFFDLVGPSVAIDVQCASSLTSVHLACQSLWASESEFAIAGGVNLIVSPDTNLAMWRASILSPDGRCKTWDAAANGFVRGEGAGLVVLRPLASALADGDRVYAVIRSSTIAHGGRADWIMAPNRAAQEAMLRRAYESACIDPRDVDYVELHGTGTRVGDPVEAAALGAVVGAGREGALCRVGTVKTNIGHLDSAAGVAGLIKTSLALHRRAIPPSLHYREPNPEIETAKMGLEVQTKLGPWPQTGRDPIAGVSAFSFGGGHAHIVLTGAGRGEAREEPIAVRPHLLALSAISEPALRALALTYAEFLAPGGAGEGATLADVCHTAALRRTHHAHRAAVLGRSREGVVRRLRALAADEPVSGVLTGVTGDRRAEPVLVFSGQAAPWWSSGRELLAFEPAFQQAMRGFDYRLRRAAGWSLLKELGAREEASGLDRIEIAHMATVALQLSLVELLRSWGVEPAAVVGHTVGELAAAATAGILPRSELDRIAVLRGRVLAESPAMPPMVALLAGRGTADALLAEVGGDLAVVAENGTRNVVVAGEPEALDRLVALCPERDVHAVRLPAGERFDRTTPEHAERLAGTIGHVRLQEGTVPFFSATSGTACSGRDLDAGHWARQLSHATRFRAAVDAAVDAGFDTFVEVGPTAALSFAIAHELGDRGLDGMVAPTLRRGRSEQWTVLEAVAALWARGGRADLGAMLAAPGTCISLPAHPWMRERLWIDAATAPTAGQTHAAGGAELSGHPLLGTRLPIAGGAGHVWNVRVDAQRLRHIEDHKVQGVTVVAGATFVEMVAVAAGEAFGWPACTLSDIELRQALVVPEGGRQVQLAISGLNAGAAEFRIHSRPLRERSGGDGWTLHTWGRVSAAGGERSLGASPADLHSRLREHVDGDSCYRYFAERGEQYGPAFRGISELWRGDAEAIARMRAPASIVAELPAYRFHPALLDAYMHTLVMAAPAEGDGGFMPVRIDEIRVWGRHDADGYSHVRLVSGAEARNGRVEADIRVLDDAGVEQMEIRGLHLQYLADTALRAPMRERWYHELEWEPVAPAASAAAAAGAGPWVVLADAAGVGERIAARLRQSGDECVLVPADRTADPGAAGAAVRSALEAGSCRGVIHLWSLDAEAIESATMDAVLRSQRLGCGAALEAVRALVRLPGSGATVHLVTKGAQVVGERPAAVAALQAPLWGFGRSLAQERPELWGGLLDLDPAADADDDAEAVVARLRSSDGEDQCARRAGTEFAARLRESRVPAADARLAWRPDASYLVTGGLGDLGLAVARWMAAGGARHLILMGRTPLPPRERWGKSDPESDDLVAARIAGVREIESLGAGVHLVAADVGDEETLRSLLARWESEGRPPIRGVFHAAGLAPFETVEQITQDGLEAVLRPKVAGGFLLHRLMPDLDFLVLFSSASGVLSSPRLAHYAAGNAFLDSLAEHRRARGMSALSIDWGPWAEVGMATRTGSGGPASLRGMELIGLDEGLDALERMMVADLTRMAVFPIEWSQWRDAYAAAARAPILRRLTGSEPAATAAAASEDPGTAAALLAAGGEERATLLRSAVAVAVAEALRLPADQLAGESLAEFGFDSLVAIEVRTRIESETGVDLAILEIVEADGVEEIAALLEPRIAELAQTAGDPFAAAGGTASGGTTDGDAEWFLDELSDLEVGALLAEIESLEGVA